MISNEALKDMRSTLMQDKIDHAEDILVWFDINGVEMIDELLECRKSKGDDG